MTIVRKHKRRTNKGRTTVKKHRRITRPKPTIKNKKSDLVFNAEYTYKLPPEVIKDMDKVALVNFLRNKEIRSRTKGTTEFEDLEKEQQELDIKEIIRKNELKRREEEALNNYFRKH